MLYYSVGVLVPRKPLCSSQSLGMLIISFSILRREATPTSFSARGSSRSVLRDSSYTVFSRVSFFWPVVAACPRCWSLPLLCLQLMSLPHGCSKFRAVEELN